MHLRPTVDVKGLDGIYRCSLSSPCVFLLNHVLNLDLVVRLPVAYLVVVHIRQINQSINELVHIRPLPVAYLVEPPQEHDALQTSLPCSCPHTPE